MPSTTLAADVSPLDFDHLTRMTLGESELEREVLELFLKQAARLVQAMADLPAETATLAHTLSGSARAVGAFRIADCAAVLEDASRRGDHAAGDSVPALAALRQALDAARPAIEARLGRSGGPR
jgi:HPt (histidine-containing phosphotransfer) domain-containing protein